MCGLGHCGASFFCSHHLVSLSVASCPFTRTKLMCLQGVFLTLNLCSGVISTRRAPVSAGWPGQAQNHCIWCISEGSMARVKKHQRAFKGNLAKANQARREKKAYFSHGDDTPVLPLAPTFTEMCQGGFRAMINSFFCLVSSKSVSRF